MRASLCSLALLLALGCGDDDGAADSGMADTSTVDTGRSDSGDDAGEDDAGGDLRPEHEGQDAAEGPPIVQIARRREGDE